MPYQNDLSDHLSDPASRTLDPFTDFRDRSSGKGGQQ